MDHNNESHPGFDDCNNPSLSHRRDRRLQRLQRRRKIQRHRRIRRATEARTKMDNEGFPTQRWNPFFNRRRKSSLRVSEQQDDVGRPSDSMRDGSVCDSEVRISKRPAFFRVGRRNEPHVEKHIPSPRIQVEHAGNSKEPSKPRSVAMVQRDDDRLVKGCRIDFSASHEEAKELDIDEETRLLLTSYMTQPVEQYSLLSFHDDDATVKSRRWIVRRLTDDEAIFYQSSDGEEAKDRFFRLAVPLLPLIGLDLTPVTDLEVLVNVTGHEENENERLSVGEGRLGWKSGRWRRKQADDEVKIKSLRVALLSTDDEVQNAMNNMYGRPVADGAGGGMPNDEQNSSSLLSGNARESVRKMGYEAIGMVGRLEEVLRPHLSFDASIRWAGGDGKDEKALIMVKASATTALTVPALPIPLPSHVIIRRIGKILTKRALKLALPKFVIQLERDLKRWATVDKEKSKNEVSRLKTLSQPEVHG